MSRKLHRRAFLMSAAATGLATAWPISGHAGIADIPRSDYGFDTTADDVVAGLDLTGKTALITGCNSGLGFESMRAMAAKGAHVIGAARNLEKAEEACASVEGRTTPVVCELTDFDTVVACSQTVAALDEPLDILICNAGIMALPERELVYGLEKQFVVNHLGHFLLTRRVMPQLEASPEARVVVLSSIGYKQAPPEGIQFDNLDWAENYSPFTAYGQSKLANALFSRELARRMAGTTVYSNSVHPGFVATNLGRYIMGRPADPDEPLRPGFKTPVQGAATQVYVATDPRLDGVSGYYFEDCNPVEPEGPHMQDDALAQKLWEVSDDLVADYLG